MAYIWIAIVVLHIPAACAALYLFDRIVKVEYLDHRAAWYADGQPHGFFWVPRECTFAGGLLVRFSSSMAQRHIWRSWLFSTPDWMTRDRQARRLLHRWRALNLGWLALIVAFFLVLIFK